MVLLIGRKDRSRVQTKIKGAAESRDSQTRKGPAVRQEIGVPQICGMRAR